MRDVLIVIKRPDVVEREARVLIDEPTAVARDEAEDPGLAGEVAVRVDEGTRVRGTALVARDGLEYRRQRQRDSPVHRTRSPQKKTSASDSVAEASSVASATRVRGPIGDRGSCHHS